MTTFNNHPPVNFDGAEQIASASTDGGSYSGIGYNRYKVMQGKRFHLTHARSSGCDYGNGTDHASEHLGVFNSKQEVIDFLLKGEPSWWQNELLEELGYEGEEA